MSGRILLELEGLTVREAPEGPLRGAGLELEAVGDRRLDLDDVEQLGRLARRVPREPRPAMSVPNYSLGDDYEGDVELNDELEAELERKGVSASDAAEVRAFARFLRAAGPAPTAQGMTDRAREAAIEVYGDEFGRGPALPPRWEGDDG